MNIVALIGRLVADPELKTTTNGNDVVTFRIAVDRPFSKDKEGQKADFLTIVAWNNTALFVSRYFSKGSSIAIRGRIQTRSYVDKNGEKRTAVEVVADEVNFCGSKEKSESNPTNEQKDNLKNGFIASGTSASDFEEITDDDDVPFCL